jgi:hypothetical protein
MNALRRLSLVFIPTLLLAAACAPAATPAPNAAFATAAPMATQAPAATVVAAEPGGIVLAPARQMIIKDAALVLTVRDVDQALALATGLAADNGGYLVRTETWVDDEARFASLNMAVPSARFEAALIQLRGLALKVEHETSSGQDVTAEYTDLRAQLTNLEATAARVRAFLDEAATVEESLHVNAELSRLEGDIERIKGQMQYYETRSAYSTINVTLQPEAPPAAAAPGWNPLATAERAGRVAVQLAQAAVDAAIWLGALLGTPALIGLIALLIVRLVVRSRPARRA